MRRILLLDVDHPSRALLVESLHKKVGTESVLAVDGADLIEKVTTQPFAGVFADTELLGDHTPAVMLALRAASPRPLVILVSDEIPETLDPDLISLVVRKPYDVPMVTGILLSAVMEMPPAAPDADQRRGFDA